MANMAYIFRSDWEKGTGKRGQEKGDRHGAKDGTEKGDRHGAKDGRPKADFKAAACLVVVQFESIY
jgi:hypothetical protein